MVEYRYMGVDLLTRKVVEDLPLYGVSLTRRISGSGNMTGSFKLGTGLFSDEDLLAASIPGKLALVAMRDDVVVWAGPIWSRTYQSQANVISLTGQTYESIFSAVKMYSSFSRIGVDQLTIFHDLIELMESQPNNDFGLDTSEIGISGIPRDLETFWYEHQMFSSPIEELLKQSNSFDYALNPYMDANEQLQIKVKTGYPYLGYGQEGVTFDYPGQLSNYWYPESAAKGSTRFTLVGKGEGTVMPYSVQWDNDKLTKGWPGFDKVMSDKTISDQVILESMAVSYAGQFGLPVITPTFDMKLTPDIEFGEWTNLGVPVTAVVEDPRFPNQITLSRRMLGWDLSPLSSESSDVLKLVLEGND